LPSLFQDTVIVHRRALLLLLIAAIPMGCDSPALPPSNEESTPRPASTFTSAACGTITGTVRWCGEQPQLPPLLAPVDPLQGPGTRGKLPRENPNLPIVDATTDGIKDAVVFLRAVDPAQSRPWDHPPARVEFREDEMFVVQGDYCGRRGLVRHGDSIEVVSNKTAFEALQGRGAAFFSLTLPEPGQPRKYRLAHDGIVELNSGAGRFWMRGHLIVSEHPYVARTDATGGFVLPEVPAGTYQLVCWHPNWHEEAREHDADSCYMSRLTFRPAAEVVRDVVVNPGVTSTVIFTLSLKDFPR
jgi:hypothetical protein